MHDKEANRVMNMNNVTVRTALLDKVKEHGINADHLSFVPLLEFSFHEGKAVAVTVDETAAPATVTVVTRERRVIQFPVDFTPFLMTTTFTIGDQQHTAHLIYHRAAHTVYWAVQTLPAG